MNTNHIETIRLSGVLPLPLEESRHSVQSELWLNEFTFHRGHSYIIAAESGTGKSSLCSFIYGNRRDYSGEIFLNGQNYRTFTPEQILKLRRELIALLPQEMRLFPELTVKENIEIKNRLTRYKSTDEINRLMELTGIDALRDRRVDTLSIGQQQRVAIVRTVCQPFDFILLDEPVSHLDARNNRIVADLLSAEAASQGAAIIATSVGNHLMLDNATTLRL